MEKLGDNLPETINFSVGYFEGKQSKKRWLCCQEDLEAMYKNYKNSDKITLWCEGKASKQKKRMMFLAHLKDKLRKVKLMPFTQN